MIKTIGIVGMVSAMVLAFALAGKAETYEGGFVRIAPDSVKWSDIPDGHGAQIAVLQGDPSKPGLYVIRVKFPPHVMSTPHTHPEDRHATVIKGTWYTGTGATFDPAKTVALKTGSYMLHPGGALHWDGAAKDEEVIVQIMGIGPSGTSALNPA